MGTQAARLQTADVEKLYRTLGPRLYQFIRKHVAGSAIAADLVQDVFVRLLRSRVEARSEGVMRSYLYRTASSVTAEHYRVARLRGTVPLEPEQTESEPALQVYHEHADHGAL